MKSRFGGRSLGLGDLLDRAKAVEAVREAIHRGELVAIGECSKVRRPERSDVGNGNAARGRPSSTLERGLLTPEDVAETLQMKLSTVRAYAERGSLPCVRVGNRLRFRPSDVDLWIEQRHSKGGK